MTDEHIKKLEDSIAKTLGGILTIILRPIYIALALWVVVEMSSCMGTLDTISQVIHNDTIQENSNSIFTDKD